MSGLFLSVLNRSIAASWLVLAVLLLRFVLKKAPKWIPIVLWGMVAFRLLCPFTIENPLSLIPHGQTIPDRVISDYSPDVQTAIIPENNPTKEYPEGGYSDYPDSSEGAVPHADNGRNVMTVVAMVWMAGVFLLILYFIFSYWRLHRQVRTAVVYRDNIFQSEHVSSPFVLGMVRPRIYLPFEIDGQNLEYVVSHEQAHIRRRDHWWKTLGFLLLAVHWFNPLMWLSYVLLCRDIELACDEKVIRELGHGQRADYSQTLLACSVSHRNIAACPLAFGEIGVKERVKSVLNYRKPAFWIITAAMVACAVVAVCFLTDPAQRRDTLVWAQELSADDIKSADLVVFPRASDKQYKSLSEEEIAAMVALINKSEGKYVAEYEELNGGAITFYITMQDGSTHKVQNMGNVYLVIDQDYYEPKHDWPHTWDDVFREGNASLPEGYFSEQPASDNEPEPEPEETAPLNTIVWEAADLDRDGETESIRVRELGEDAYELEVLKKDGTVLWSKELGTAHMGQGSILLYQDDGEDYLMEYNPTMYQGIGSYACRTFTLEGGHESENYYREVEFNVSDLLTTDDMRTFAVQVDYMLWKSTVLLSTIEGELVVGPRTAEEVPLLYPVQFWPASVDIASFIGEDALEDFLPREFWFGSGAGGWSTILTLYPDGHFEGEYEDADADMSYYCKFNGQFGDITKVSEYAYTMRLEELTYETELDREWTENQRHYIGSDAYGLTGGEEFVLYLPGTPLEELDEEFVSWYPDWRNSASDRILSAYGICNVNTGYGFFTSWLQ